MDETNQAFAPEKWWSAATIAQYADYSVKRLEAQVLCDPTFPAPRHFWEGAHPRWRGWQVIAWFEGASPSLPPTHGSNAGDYSSPDAQSQEQGPEEKAA